MYAMPEKSFELDELEPSILSSDPNERKLARRLRIQKRSEAQIKQETIEHEETLEKTATEKQILESLILLDKLSMEGDEVVSSVKVANDARELQRRKDEQEVRKNLLRKLEENGEECMKRYREINEKWPDIIASKDPLDIHAEIAAQNEKCLEVLAKKDAVIAELKQELENADLKFAQDQKKQSEDIDLLTERMDNQASIMAKAYHLEMELIGKAVDSERKVLLETAIEKWNVLYKKLQDGCHEGIEKRKEIMREYEEEMQRVMLEYQEEFRAQKISLEREIQKLQQAVQSTKAVCLMNVEKLNYSYAVLKRREEENAIVKNQQKRRINKLQDVVNGLKKNYTELEENSRLEIQRLTDQILKARNSILELEKKSERFAKMNEKQFMQIWDMNTKSANELIDKILTIDRILHEQMLEIDWQPPQQTLLAKEDLPSYRVVLDAIEKQKVEINERKRIIESYKPATTLEEINLERRLLNHIIKLISDRSNYLIEDSLSELLLPYTADDKLVVRLDNVFQALKINSKKQLNFLLYFFLPYTYCPTCTTTDTAVQAPDEECVKEVVVTSPSKIECSHPDTCKDTEEFTEEEARLVEIIKQEIFTDESLADDDVCVAGSLSENSSVVNSPSSGEEVCSDPIAVETEDDKPRKHQLLCDKGHLLEIQTTHVTKALKEFVEKYHFFKSEETSSEEKRSMNKLSISRSLTTEDITEFWKRYTDIFPESKERLWDGLLIGLKKYYEVLKERHRLNLETASLKKQNADLQCLLKTYTVKPEDQLTEESIGSSNN